MIYSISKKIKICHNKIENLKTSKKKKNLVITESEINDEVLK